MSDFTLVPLDPTDHDLVQSRIDTAVAAHAHDRLPTPPPRPGAIMLDGIQHRIDSVQEHWVAVADGRVTGFATLRLPTLDNTHNVRFDVCVHPDHRHRGLGSALLEHVEARAAELGRTNLTCRIRRPVPEGPQFAEPEPGFLERRGYSAGMEVELRVVDLDNVDDIAIERLWTEAWSKAEGFELVVFEGLPDVAHIDGVGYLHGRVYSDAPSGDLEVGEVEYDADRVRCNERILREQGSLHLQALMVHAESGTVAAFTEITILAGEEHAANQGDTIVDPRFRGHRLGTILKIANQRRIREWRPKLRYVWTGNAADNKYMIAINEAVGYRLGVTGPVLQKNLI